MFLTVMIGMWDEALEGIVVSWLTVPTLCLLLCSLHEHWNGGVGCDRPRPNSYRSCINYPQSHKAPPQPHPPAS
jgi:hypothetical protein